jgi:secreted trypsin-like serine protease
LKAAQATASPKIVGGTPASRRSNPFQVALLATAIANNKKAFFCGGSLIKEDVVVTAAHCSDFITNPSSQVQVLTGSQDLDGSGKRRNVSSIVVHHKFNPLTLDSDIAIWFLASKASGITLARLAETDPKTGTELLATGWGDMVGDPDIVKFPVQLQQVKLPLVSRRKCNGAGSYNGLITRNMICAAPKTGGEGICQGDSGGPLALSRQLIGITSFTVNFGCALADFPSGFTRVSRFRDWVLQQIN